MKKIGIHKKLMMLTAVVGMMLLVASCGPTYVRTGYGRPYGYGYNYPRPYRYAVPPPVVVVPRYCPPPRRSYGRGNGYGRRRW
jgi:hypothetical protein